MPRSIPIPVRQVMFRLWQQGYDAPQIAVRLDVSCPTVYRLLQRFRRDGVAGVTPGYAHAADQYALPEAVNAALALRREHPTWEAPTHTDPTPRSRPDAGNPLSACAATMVRSGRPLAGTARPKDQGPCGPRDIASRCLANGCKGTYYS